MAENELVPFVLQDVEGLDAGDKKGSGAYGAVYRVTVKGVTCIAKRLHDILINPEVSADEKASVRRKFSAECILLSQLRHPHVVHFVGVHYGKRSDHLSLIMECLHMDLARFSDACTTKKLSIPMSIKLSILLDVSYGLLYFHTHSPPIIHRDLSANNILLTTDLRAKIADLGVAKLLESQTQVAIAQTKAPGTLYYMPPEALQENPVYDLKLDIFSFGHLMLYAAAQKFPDVHELDDATMYVALQDNTVQFHKRRKVIEQIGGKQHCLHSILTQCLQDKLERRPTAYQLNERLKELCTEHPRSVAEVLKLITDAVKTPSQDEEQLNGQNWLELKRELAAVQEENRKLTVDVGTLHRDKQLLEEASKTAQARIKELDVLVEKLQTWRRLKESQLKDTEYKPTPELLPGSQLQERVSTDSELERKLSEQHQVIQRLQQEIKELQSSLQIVKIEAELFKEDFESERRDREAAHGKIADLMTKHEEETGKLKAELLQAQLEEMKQTCHVLQKEKKQLIEQFKKISELNDDSVVAINESKVRVRRLEQEKEALQNEVQITKTELEVHKELLTTERDKLSKELEKVRKELEKERKKTEEAKTEAGKFKEAKAKQKAKKRIFGGRSGKRRSISDVQLPPARRRSYSASPLITTKRDETTEQGENPPLQLHEQPPPTLSVSNPGHLPPGSDQAQIAGQYPTGMQPAVSPHRLPPGNDQAQIAGQNPTGMQPAVPPHRLPPGSDQAQIPDQYPAGVQPTVTPSADQPPQGQYPQGEPITPTEEANRDHAAKVSKPVEESCPDLPEQRQKRPSAQQDENSLMKGLDTEIHDAVADVEANVQSKEELDSLQGAPMDPNLVCPMCGYGYRVGEIQRYRRHVKSCHGSKGQ